MGMSKGASEKVISWCSSSNKQDHTLPRPTLHLQGVCPEVCQEGKARVGPWDGGYLSRGLCAPCWSVLWNRAMPLSEHLRTDHFCNEWPSTWLPLIERGPLPPGISPVWRLLIAELPRFPWRVHRECHTYLSQADPNKLQTSSLTAVHCVADGVNRKTTNQSKWEAAP